MQIAFHAGAHFTNAERIKDCLMSNRKILDEIGTFMPPLFKFRNTFRELMLNKESKTHIDAFRESIMPEPERASEVSRLVLSNMWFFGTPRMGISVGELYSTAVQRLYATMNALPEAEIELYFSIRDMATFVPEIMEHGNYNSIDEMIGGKSLDQIRWAGMIQQIRDAFPFMPITVWCNEDLPFVWGEVIRDMAGLNPSDPFKGEYEMLDEIMNPVGVKRLHGYIETHPGIPEAQKRRVIAAFLDKYALEDAFEAELDMPGWTDEVVDYLSSVYDEDVENISQIQGVNLITP